MKLDRDVEHYITVCHLHARVHLPAEYPMMRCIISNWCRGFLCFIQIYGFVLTYTSVNFCHKLWPNGSILTSDLESASPKALLNPPVTSCTGATPHWYEQLEYESAVKPRSLFNCSFESFTGDGRDEAHDFAHLAFQPGNLAFPTSSSRAACLGAVASLILNYAFCTLSTPLLKQL